MLKYKRFLGFDFCLNCDFNMIFLITVIIKNHINHFNHLKITVQT